MLTTNPDSTPAPPAIEEAPAAPAPEGEASNTAVKSEAPKKPIPMAWIPATLGLGLLLAILYLGGRIITAKAHSAPSAPAAPVAQKVPAAATPAPPAAVAETPKPDPFQPQAPAPAQPVVQAKVEAPVPPPTVEPKPPAVKPERVAEIKTPVPAPQPADVAPSEDLAGLPTITPQAGQRYIQIGALIPKAAHRYLDGLKLSQLDPHIAPGPTPELVRVLVGPFRDRDSSAAVQAQLDAQGIQNFVRVY